MSTGDSHVTTNPDLNLIELRIPEDVQEIYASLAVTVAAHYASRMDYSGTPKISGFMYSSLTVGNRSGCEIAR